MGWWCFGEVESEKPLAEQEEYNVLISLCEMSAYAASVRPYPNLSQFPDIRVCDVRTGVCSVGANTTATGLSELTEECRKADLQFDCPEYHATVLIVVFPVSAGWSPG